MLVPIQMATYMAARIQQKHVNVTGLQNSGFVFRETKKN